MSNINNQFVQTLNHVSWGKLSTLKAIVILFIHMGATQTMQKLTCSSLTYYLYDLEQFV